MSYRYFFPFVLLFCVSFAWLRAVAAPLRFVENAGQITDQYDQPRPDIDFKVAAATTRGPGVFIGNGKSCYQWVRPGKDAESCELYRLDVILLGASGTARAREEQPQSYFERYYLPFVGKSGAVARSFGRVRYEQVYHGIDQVYYFDNLGRLEYDFVVKPGGNPADIRISYGGATALRINADGSLTATTPLGELTQHAPQAYEQATKRKIPVRFKLENDVLVFETGSYQGTLVIDPVLSWASYFGGWEYDNASSVAAGMHGDIYFCGSTNSMYNVATTGAYETSYAGGNQSEGGEAYLARFTQSGDCLWATYYGGSGIDQGKSVAIDSAGYVYLAGRTQSTAGIATTGSYQEVKAGTATSYDAFLVKLDSTGNRIWGTYFGGTGIEGPAIKAATDRMGHVYLAGGTASSSGIATPGAFRTTRQGQEGFLARFTEDGMLSWATYYGDAGSDYATGVAADTTGNVYLCGYTTSTAGIASTGAYQITHAGGNDAYLAKFDSSGQRLWATYLGTTESDQAQELTAAAGGVFVTGTTSSVSGMASAGAHQTTSGGDADGFIARFSDSGELIWSSYYGGSGTDAAYGMHFSRYDHRLYVSGMTMSTAGMSTSGALRDTLSGLSDAFIVAMDTSGVRQWASYYGGWSTDAGNGGHETGFALSGTEGGALYMVGLTSSDQALSTQGAYQDTLGGISLPADGFILKISLCALPQAAAQVSGPASVCAGGTYTYYATGAAGVDSYVWSLPQGWSGNSTADSIVVTLSENSGTITVRAENACGTGSVTTLSVDVHGLPVAVIARNGDTLQTTELFASYQWERGGVPISGATGPVHIVSQNGDYTVRVTDTNGCSGLSQVISVSDVTTVRELAKQGIRIYPNPVVERLTLELPFKVRVLLSDMSGRLLISQALSEGTQVMDLDQLADGLYLLRLSDQQGRPIGAAKLVIGRN